MGRQKSRIFATLLQFGNAARFVFIVACLSKRAGVRIKYEKFECKYSLVVGSLKAASGDICSIVSTQAAPKSGGFFYA